MAYVRDITLSLGAGKAGLTDLRAQLVDTAGTNVGSAVSTGFVDLGIGTYLWHYAAFPDSHRGAVKFYSNAASSTTLAVTEINPEEAENTDVKTSTRSSQVSVDAIDTAVDVGIASILTDLGTANTNITGLGTNLTTVLARIGAFTGSGLNTILGFFRALGRSTAALTPSDMGGTYDNTTDALEAIRDRGDAAWLTPTAAAMAAISASLVGNDLTILRGDTIVINFTNIGALTSRTKLWFTLKRSKTNTDAQAILQVEETAGLIRLNGAAAVTASDASLAVTDIPTGDVTLTIKATTSDDLSIAAHLYWDIQVAVGAVVTTLVEGEARVSADVTRAVA